MSAAVIPLPTAAPKKVRQPVTRAARAAKDDLPQFPVDKVFEASPYMENCKRIARDMLDADTSAAMQLALSVYSVLDDRQRIRVLGRLAALTVLRKSGANCAASWIAYEDAPKHRKADIDRAAALVVQEGW